MKRDSSLKDGNTSSVQACQTYDHKISITQIYTLPLSNMEEEDIETLLNFTDRVANI